MRWFTLVLLVANISTGQEPVQDTASDWPKLQPAFSDDFATDTRSEYEIKGDIGWELGKLKIAAGASVERFINGGPWAKVELKSEPVELTDQQPRSELRVWFIMDGATNCCVRLRNKLEGAKTVSSIALIDMGEKDGKPIEVVVREIVTDAADLHDISIEYRHGLIRVGLSGADSLAAYISNGNAPVRAVALQCEAAAAHASSLRLAAAVLERKQYSEAEKQQLAKAVAGNRELTGLYQKGKFANAAKVGEQVLAIAKSVLGEKHPDYALSLFKLATLYHRMGDTRAEPLYKQALGIQKAVLGENHPLYANSLNNLAAMYKSSGDYVRAEPLYIRASGIRKTVLGEKHPDYANSLNNLATLYETMGDYARAEPLHKQALTIRNSVVGKQHPDYATSLNNLAAFYSRMGDYARAEPLNKQALAIRKSVLGEKHPGFAQSLNNLASLYEHMGEYTSAEPLHKQALAIRKGVVGEEHPDFAQSLNNLASLYERMGDYARAEPLYKRASGIWKSVLGMHHPDYLTSLNNLAALYQSMGDYARAEPLFIQSLNTVKSVLGEKHPRYAASLNNLAFLYQAIGDSARAEPLFKQSLDIQKAVVGEEHPAYATTVNNLALLYTELGEDIRAEPLYDQALAIRKSALGAQHPDYAASIGNLAALDVSMRRYARAEPRFKKALAIRKAVLGEQHPDYAHGLISLALLYTEMGEDTRAEPLFKQAMGIQRFQLNRNAAIQSARQQSRNQNEKRLYLDSRLANSIAAAEPEASSVAAGLWEWKGAVTARQQAYRKVASDLKLAPLFQELQSVTRQLSVASGQIPVPPPESASETKNRAFRQKREIWEQRVAKLTREREDLEQQIATDSLEFRRVIEPLTADMVQALLPIGTAFIDFLEYNHSTRDPKKKGKTNYERRYLAVVVRTDGPVRLVPIGAADPISEAIGEFRRPLTGKAPESPNGKPVIDAASKLRETVWLPLVPHLGGIETVVISPDTALGTLPFGALPGKKPGSYLIEEYKFASLPLAGMLRSLFDENAEHPQSKESLLVLGDVNYNANSNSLLAQVDSTTLARPTELRRSAPRSESDRWESLPGFQQELTAVRNQFSAGSVSILRKNLATEAAFMRQAANHSHLHLITHGYFADPKHEAIGTGLSGEDQPFAATRRSALASSNTINQYVPGLLSGIVLAGANNPPPTDDPNADGILTASEIEALDLNGVDLVVLSACETGLGKTAGGEGLTGLQRAFHIAGVRSCIATLWEVDDRATQEFMKRFYGNLWDKNMSKIDAFREAQLYLLNNPVLADGTRLTRGAPGKTPKQDPNAKRRTSEKTDPYFWAAFQLSGDWR